MKRIALVFAVALLVLAIISGCVQEQPQGEETIKIGVILPLTGSGSDQGKWQQEGLELAVEEINDSNGINGKKITLLLEDSKGGNTAEGISAYNRIKASENVPAVITWGSGVGMALSELANKDKTIHMGIATATPAYSTKGDFTFRVFPSSKAEAVFDANFARQTLGISKAAVIFVQNDYGVGSKSAFVGSFEGIGGAIVGEQAIEAGAVDVRTQLLKIEEENPDAIFCAVYPKEGGIMLKQAKELGMDTPFFCSSAILGNKELFDIAGNSAEGLTVSAVNFNPDSTDGKTESFVEKYYSKFGEKPNQYAALGYDGLRVIAKAMQSCQNPVDSECLKRELYSIRNYDGLVGNISFDENGDSIKEFQLLKVKNQEFVPYEGG